MKIEKLSSLKMLSNTYVIKNNNKCFIVDCGANLLLLKNAILDAKPEGILLTHSHFDHISYLTEYINEYNCPVYCNSECYERLKDSTKNLSKKFLNYDMIHNVTNYVCLDNLKEITLADVNIKIMHVPGHSNCSVAYVVKDNIFCGDVVFENGIGRTDFFDGNIDTLRNSIKEIYKMAPITVNPGHGESFYLNGLDN